MPDTATIEFFYQKFMIGALIFVRVLAVMTAAPFFKNSAVIPQVKIFFAGVIAVLMTVSFGMEQPVIDFHLWNLAVLVIKEFLAGVAIGFAVHLVFHAARFAGGILDIEMGYQTALLFDQNTTTPTLIGNLKEFAVLMLFLIFNGHHYLIESVFASLRIVPLTEFALSDASVRALTTYAASVFIIAIKMSAPVLVALFCTNLSLALLARVAPQTNIFILSFQLKVAVGLIMLLISVPLMIYIMKWALNNFQQEAMRMLMTMQV
jgi:flagellar biosynthetic protein FliR